MKIIIYVTHSPLDGNQVRFRTSETPGLHIQEFFGADTLEDAYEYAEAFERGAKVAGAETILAVHEEIHGEISCPSDTPVYTVPMMKAEFSDAWEALGL